MRSPRLKLLDCVAVYHCVSRIVGGALLLGDAEKERFRKLMWVLADFCGVEIIAHTLMSNHIHLVVRVPVRGPISDEELARRVRLLYPKNSSQVQAIAQDLKATGKISPQLRERYLKRMGDVSMFFKELKQRYTRWYNRKHERYGTLWAERFKSLIVEDQYAALLTAAAYTDLNAVRAGLVEDPKDYRFCGYAEAVVMDGKARAGLASFLPGKTWREKAGHYREYLFCRAEISGHADKVSLTREQIRAKLRKDGQLALNEVLRLRVRYLTDGAVLGSREFVDACFRRFRPHFGSRRKEGARPMKGAEWGGLMVLRALQQDVFG